MRVLFVSRYVKNFGVAPLVYNQGLSLIKEGIDVNFFTIKGRGLKAYIDAIPRLRKELKENKYDLIHSHYSLSSFIAFWASNKPVVASLMGSDVRGGRLLRFIIKTHKNFFWSETIVKSEDMKKLLNIRGVRVIPNGVNFKRFKPIEREIALKRVGWPNNVKHLLFAANKNRPVKNYKLAEEVYKLIRNKEIEMHYLDDVPNKLMPFFLNAADSILLTSYWEGSPNVIKEAMACNTPIVTTNVGDVKKIIGKTEGCFVVSYQPQEIAERVIKALNHGKTSGRTDIGYLDSKIISKEIVNLYNNVIN